MRVCVFMYVCICIYVFTHIWMCIYISYLGCFFMHKLASIVYVCLLSRIFLLSIKKKII